MYTPAYSSHTQSMRPPTHTHAPPPPLHIHTSPAPSQSRYLPYNMVSIPGGNTPLPSQHPQQQPPPSPSTQSERASEEDYSNLPGPGSKSYVWGGRIWALEIVQHPQRARMCGFGDKDRRPISPPPCVRLIIKDEATGKEIKYNDVELAFFVLHVDIYDLRGAGEMNLVKQSNASPCISSAATGSFPTTAQQPSASHQAPPAFDANRMPANSQANGFGSASQKPTNGGYNAHEQLNGRSFQNGHYGYPNGASNGHGMSGQAPPFQNGTPSFRPTPIPYGNPPFQASQAPQNGFPGPMPPGQLPPMTVALEQSYTNAPSLSSSYTRNLIGSLCASAFKLEDENGVTGIWFVLQDLSVRTEGWFRLKMNFFNLAGALEDATSDASDGKPGASTPASAPCLASAYTNPFKVFSAKKFPGVVESTPLSKAFALQGIKIPIRKDGNGKRGKDDGSEDGEMSGAED